MQDDTGNWIARPDFQHKVKEFVRMCNTAGIGLLAEVGPKPDQYQQEWEHIFKAGPKDHLAINAKVNAVIPFSEEYTNKGARTLADGSRGYLDFQYNWLGWYGDNMEVVVDMGKEVTISQVSISFLEDQRHWAFLPVDVQIGLSADGNTFSSAGALGNPFPEENYEVAVKDYSVNLRVPAKSRFVKVTATNLKKLPPWRYYKGRKAWLFADEIMVR